MADSLKFARKPRKTASDHPILRALLSARAGAAHRGDLNAGRARSLPAGWTAAAARERRRESAMRTPARWAAARKRWRQSEAGRLTATAGRRLAKRYARLGRRARVAALAVLVLLVLLLAVLVRRAGRDDDGDDGEEDDDDSAGPWKPERFRPELVERARAKWKPTLADGLSEEVWARIKDDVAVGVKTGHEVAESRLRKLRRSGWFSVGRDVPNLIIVSDTDNEALGVVGIKNYAYDLLHSANRSRHAVARRKGARPGARPGAGRGEMPHHWFDKTGWRGDKDKNLPALHLLRRTFPGKKWYLLLDDDTYIFLENFARYVTQKQLAGRAVYTGKVFYISRCGGFLHDGTFAANRSQPRGLFAHGGSGIIMNGKAMERMFPRIGQCILDFSSCWAGDMQVGLCMRKSGVMPLKHGGRTSYERHFIPFWPSKALSDRRYIQRWKSAEEPVTFHKIPDREQELMSQFERKVAANGEPVVYTELREHLMDHGILPCHTEHNKRVKWYTTEFMPPGFKG